MNNKQQTAVDIIYQGISDKIVMQDTNKALICIHISHDDFLKLHRQAKAMHKEEHGKTWDKSLDNLKARGMNEMRAYTDFDEYYNETFGQ